MNKDVKLLNKISKLKPIMYEKNYMPQLSVIYSRDARLAQYSKNSYGNPVHQQAKKKKKKSHDLVK